MRKVNRSSVLGAPFILSGAYAGANVLTRLIPDLYAALDVVSRELVGFIPSVERNMSAERAAVGQSIVWPITPEVDAQVVTPAMQIPEPPDVEIDHGVMTIDTVLTTPFGWTGEEQRGLNANGPGYLSIQAGLFAQGLRTLVNGMELALAVEASANASRAYGTAGTTPFGGDKMTDTAQVRKILDDNGAPLFGRALIIDTAAGANLRSMYNLTRANEAGTQMVLTDGNLINLHGFNIKESAGIQPFTVGTGAGATTNAAGYSVGARVITLASAGTGTIKAGDVITFAGDTNQYMVASGDADVSGGGTITLASPGLRVAIPAAATAITVVTPASGTQLVKNVAFSADALRLAARAPAMPVEGDARIDSTVITDPRSGMSFEVSIWPGYRKVRAEVAIAYGVKAVKPAHIAALLG